jgi:hypothetical protein
MVGITFTKQVAWHYVIHVVAVHATRLAGIAVTLQYPRTYLAPFAS